LATYSPIVSMNVSTKSYSHGDTNMRLTAIQVKNAKPKDKVYRIADQGGI